MEHSKRDSADDYIPPVDPGIGNCDQPEMDPGSARLLAAELDYIRRRRQTGQSDTEVPPGLSGLALSGGGIRSATFSLGILQALAAHGILSRIDYLSTVSGGGYMGSSLSWLVSGPGAKTRAETSGESGSDASPGEFGLNAGDFPYGTDNPEPDAEKNATPEQQGMLRYLRRHGYYLTPGAGISASSLIAVALRGAYLNLMVWIPVLIILFGISFQLSLVFPAQQPLLLSTAITQLTPELQCTQSQDPGTERICDRVVPHGGDSSYRVRLPSSDQMSAHAHSSRQFDETVSHLHLLLGFEYFLWIFLFLLVFAALRGIIYSLLTWWRGEQLDSPSAIRWYHRRRALLQLSSLLVPASIASLMIGVLPLISVYLESWLAMTGPIAIVSGMGIAINSFLRPGSAAGTGKLHVSIAAGLFLYGVLIVAYQLAFLLFVSHHAFWTFPLLGLTALLSGWFVNLNYISIHRYYRDRLMETFMPDIRSALANKTGAAENANVCKLQNLLDRDHPTGPYPLINTNVVLVNSNHAGFRNRGGDNFILSPGYCGSNATGWRRTGNFMGGQMTLATAIAISGAAANPNTGVGGTGITRNPILSLAMSLMNLGLGFWASNPDPTRQKERPPNHFSPGLYALGSLLAPMQPGFGYHENRRFIQLSDGGHFENMAVYELVRRRLKLIIVCDGGADPDFSFSDFQSTIRRIEDDFGARIKVMEKASPDQIVPYPREGATYPENTSFADQGHMVGTIFYADGTEGTIIFLKTTLIDEVTFKVKGYAAQNRAFPDESTADQFFDEVQFEAYRELGYAITCKMLDALHPDSSSLTLAEYIESLYAVE